MPASKKARKPGQLIRKGPRRYLVRVWQGIDATGKRRYWSKTITASSKEAKAFLERKLAEQSQGIVLTDNLGILGDWLTFWLENIAAVNLRQSTLDQYAFLLRSYILPTFGDMQLRDFKRPAIEAWIKTLIARELSARTVHLAASVLHNAAQALVDRGELKANPCADIRLPKKQRADVSSLTVEQARILIEGVKNTRFETLWLILLHLGLRPGEALALRWQDVENGCVAITRSLSWTSTGPKFSPPKTLEGRRSIEIDEHMQEHLANRRAGAKYQARSDLIFCTESGGPMDWRNVRKRYFKPQLPKLDLPSIRGYDLRHTCATLLLAAGVNPVVVAARLGHKSTAFMLDTYAHVLPHQQAEASRSLTALLSGPRA